LLGAALTGCGAPTAPSPEPDAVRPSLGVEVDYIPISRCGTVITEPGRYRLIADLIDCRHESGRPIEIRASHVELDLNRRRIAMTQYNSDDDWGILIDGVTDVIVRGPGTIERFFWFGILVRGSSGVTLTRVTSQDNVESNVIAYDVTDLTLHDNRLLRGGYASLDLRASSSRILYNRITSSQYGENTVYVEGGSTALEFRGNVVEGGYGVVVRASGNTFVGNTVTNTIGFSPGAVGNRVIENVFGSIEDENGCGPNVYKGNWFTAAYPACLQVPRVGR